MFKLTEIVYLIFIGSVKGASASIVGNYFDFSVHIFMHYELNRSHGNLSGIRA